MLKKVAHAVLFSGLLLAPLGVSARHPHPTEPDFVDDVRLSKAANDGPFLDQSQSADYEIRISKADSDSPFPDQSDSNDYGIRKIV